MVKKMTPKQARDEFIQLWGALGSDWGISRTMAQVHALLLVSSEPMDTDAVMAALQISRGNANTNLRELISWGLVHKVLKAGDRKDFFQAEKDMWEVTRCIIRERKKRELNPLKRSLENLTQVKGKEGDTEHEEFLRVVTEIQEIANASDNILDRVAISDQKWFMRTLTKIVS